MSRHRGALYIVFSFLIWSTWGISVKLTTIPGWLVCFWVGLFSVMVTPISAAITKTPLKAVVRPESKNALVAIGVLSLFNNLAYLTSLKFTSVTNAVFSHYTAPALVALLAPFTIGEKLLKSAPLALLLSMGGLYLMLPLTGAQGNQDILGISLGLLSAVAYALLVLLTRKFATKTSAVGFVFYSNLIMALGVLPWALVAPLPPPGELAFLFILGAVHSHLAPLIYLKGIRAVAAQTAATTGYIEPLIGVFLAWAVLGEAPAALSLLGGGMILLGGGMVLREELS